MTTIAQFAQTQAAVDRKRHTGLGPTPANPLSWKQAIASPNAGFTFYSIEANHLTGVALAGGGDGATGPRLWLRPGLDHTFREITNRLPADATGDLLFMTGRGTSWWAAGVDAAGTGGWLAYSADDGTTWTSWTVFASITAPVRCLYTISDGVLWIGGDSFLKVWTAPATWTDLSLALGWTEPVRDIATLDNVHVMVVGGALPAATTCAFTANSGLTWTDRTAALGAAGPVYDVNALPGQWVVSGADVLKRSGTNGANWDNWLTPQMALALPFWVVMSFLTELIVGTNLGIYQLFDGGFIETPYPVKIMEPVRAIAITHPEIFVAGSDVWMTTQGGAVLAYEPFITEVRPSPAKWISLTTPGGVAHYGRCRLTSIIVTGSVADTITIYDNIIAAGASFTLNLPAGGTITLPFTHPLQMVNGVTVTFTQATTNVQVAYVG